jgi:farnesol dehydrogenase
VHALYRSEIKASVLQHDNIRLFRGDILDGESINRAVRNCEEVYHVAGYTRVWEKDPTLIYHLNITGTLNILDASIKAGVKRMVFVSTAGVFDPLCSEDIITENTKKKEKDLLPYESSKAIMEQILRSMPGKSPEIIIVNPTRVYGPGELSKSNSVTAMVKSYLAGKWRFIPGDGESVGNYVYIDDVVEGLILSMKKGIPGEQYILGGDNISYNGFFSLLTELSGKEYFMIRLPFFVMYSVSSLMVFISMIFGTQPLITPLLVRKFNLNWFVSSEKARIHLGYSPGNMKEGLIKTLEWLQKI